METGAASKQIPIPAIDDTTKEQWQIPRSELMTWLGDRGYAEQERLWIGGLEFELHATSAGTWAIYHPAIVRGTDTECLYVNIQTEARARELLAIAQQLLQPAAGGMFGMMDMLDEFDDDED